MIEIDSAADRAAARSTGTARRHAIEHGARAFQDFDALDEVCRDGVVRRDPIQAVQPKIAAVIVETADEQTVGATACRLNDADRGIVRQNVADRPRLLILRSVLPCNWSD